MAMRKHCDICDAQIPERSGGVVKALGLSYGANEMKDDLCQAHFNGMRRIINKYKVFEQGGMVDWPTERIRV